MGTNYYLEKDFCPCCGKAREYVHLGKSSCGWKFLFHKTEEVYDYDSFCKFIRNGIIYDEYGSKHSIDYLLNLINNKQNEKSDRHCIEIDRYDFLEGEFS